MLVKPLSRIVQAVFSGLMLTALSWTLAGCGADQVTSLPPPPINPPPPPVTNPGVGFTGKAMAGSQPIVGAAVQLYAAGTTGDGSAGSALLTTALTTDTAGAFTVAAGYACPATSSQLYVIVRGGQLGSSASNAAITLATPIGTCSQLAANSQFVINEVTFVVEERHECISIL